jgi:hypothetical protein
MVNAFRYEPNNRRKYKLLNLDIQINHYNCGTGHCLKLRFKY